ncbi:hypothetical protein HN451_03630 [archaeon]|nr:hypothetical protein [archaeon]
MGSYAKEYRTFWYNMKRYGLSLSKEEIKQVAITVFMIAFVWSFDDWGGEKFSLFTGLFNFASSALFALICILFNQIGQRFVSVYYGYDPVYEYGMMGLMLAIVITFASRGLLIFFLPGGINVRHLTASRLGEFRYYTNDWEWAKVGFMGPFMNMVLAIALSPFKSNPFVSQLMFMSILFAIFAIIPLPQNLGLYLFYPHVHFWTFTVAFVAGTAATVYFLPPVVSLILGFVVGAYMINWHFNKKDAVLAQPWYSMMK